jgi:hypothetical protein
VLIAARALWLLPLAPTLTPGEQQYVNDLKQHGIVPGDTGVSGLVDAGHSQCVLAADGNSRTSMVELIAFTHPEFSQSQDAIIVDAAISDLCPWQRVKP